MSYYVTEVKISSSSGRACVIFRCHSLSLIDGQLHIIENEANRPNLVALFHWHHEHIFRDFFSVFSQTLKMDANNNYNSEELDSSSPSKAGFNAKVRKNSELAAKFSNFLMTSFSERTSNAICFRSTTRYKTTRIQSFISPDGRFVVFSVTRIISF